MTKPLDIAGIRFKRLVAIRRVSASCQGALWECKCDCGATRLVLAKTLRDGRTGSCGCLSRDLSVARGIARGITLRETQARLPPILGPARPSPTEQRTVAAVSRMTGKTFGKLTVISRAGQATDGSFLWLTRCACGKAKTVATSRLTTGRSTSCGCERAFPVRHGFCRRGKASPEHMVWSAMVDRCRNPNNKSWRNYGGRGITVADQWVGRGGFETFIAHIGTRTSPHLSIDRIDNDGGYEPGNVRWATRHQQSINRRDTRRHPDGTPLATLVRTSADRDRIYQRIDRGWPTEEAISVRSMRQGQSYLPHPNRKLTDDQVAEIRSLYNTGTHTQAHIAAAYGVTQLHVSRLVRGALKVMTRGAIQADTPRRTAK